MLKAYSFTYMGFKTGKQRQVKRTLRNLVTVTSLAILQRYHNYNSKNSLLAAKL